jgi:hypothetical protein
MRWSHIRIILAVAVLSSALISCGPSEEEKARMAAEQRAKDSVAAAQKTADSLAAIMKPRQEVYDAAVGMVKSQLKAPSSAHFAAVMPQDDTVKIKMHGKDTAVVIGEYDAQNGFGVFLHDAYKVAMRRDSTGKWVGRMGLEALDVRMSYNPTYDHSDF